MCGLESKKEAEAKARKEAKKRRVVKEKEWKKRILEYLQQLWKEILEKNAILLKGAKESQIMRSKYKEVSLRNDADC